MPLPKISTPLHYLELPSSGEEVEYRPFIVKEEKLLLLAMESEDTREISTAIKTVIKNCIRKIKTKKGEISGDDLDKKVENLPTFDIEYLFLNIRSRSVGEEVEVGVVCPDDDETVVNIKININDINVIKNEKHNKIINVDDNIKMVMKYPTLEQFTKNNFDLSANDTNQSFDLIASCVDSVIDGDEVIDHADVTKEEIIDFLDQMNSLQFSQINDFFETMPKLAHEVEVVNPKTKVKSKVLIEGLQSFFA
jgi:hypothetical protein